MKERRAPRGPPAPARRPHPSGAAAHRAGPPADPEWLTLTVLDEGHQAAKKVIPSGLAFVVAGQAGGETHVTKRQPEPDRVFEYFTRPEALVK